MSNLDLDVIFAEILPRLPTKSLMRFKCVSKSFKYEISSPSFAQRHYSLCTNDGDLLILPDENHVKCYDLVSSTMTTTFAWRPGGSVILVGSCNGLLCILTRNTSEYLSVLNPTTRICQDILIPPVNDKLDQTIGFAFDHQNLDFKIVHHFDKHCNYGIKARITRIYSLNTKSWKVIKFPFPNDSIQKTAGKLINNNLLHWLFSNTSSRKYRIGCFDICKNDWTHDVLLPHYYYNPYHKNYLVDFGVLDNRLFSTFENQVNSCFDVWVMNEYGIQDSWVKLLSIRGSSCFPWGVLPIACHKGSGKLLVRRCNSSKYFWYTKSYGGRTEGTFDEAPEYCNLQAYICKRSLVEVPGGKLFLGK